MAVIHAFEVLVLVLSFLFTLGCRALVRRAYATYRRAWWARERDRLTAHYGLRKTVAEELEEWKAARAAGREWTPLCTSAQRHA